jgi:dihydropteroate synthase
VSTRPGAEEIPEEEEIRRLSPVLEALRRELPDIPISLDTWRSGVAKAMHERHGIHMINDISAGELDPGMFSTVARLGIPYIMMHMQGTPADMQEAPSYRHVTDDIVQYFAERIFRLRKQGIADILVDPGFGFGKTMEQNYQLLRELDAFAMLELPVLVGLSRKSMLYRALDVDAAQALNATTAAHMAALMGGASILRVHDVAAARECVEIFRRIVHIPRDAV